jgi:hypothetical protein
VLRVVLTGPRAPSSIFFLWGQVFLACNKFVVQRTAKNGAFRILTRFVEVAVSSKVRPQWSEI